MQTATREHRYSWMICSECGSVRMRTPSGTVCPRGHGKLYPRVTNGQLNVVDRYRWADSLPTATKVDGDWMIDDHPGFFEVTKRPDGTRRVPTRAVAGLGYVLAVIRKHGRLTVRQFKKTT